MAANKFTHLPNDTINYYILSSDIKVFPTAYRGKTGDNKHINVESMLSTESSLRHLSPEIANRAYIISWEGRNAADGLLCCSIGGYYFEIKIKESDLTIDNTTYNKLWIYTTQKALSETSADDIEYTTKLGSWKEAENSTSSNVVYEDILDYGINDVFYFTGLKFSATAPSSAESKNVYCLNLTITNSKRPVAINYTKIESSNSDEHIGGSIFDGTNDQNEIVIGALRLNNPNNKVTGSYSIAAGSSTEVTGNNSIAIGEGTKANYNNQFVFGKYNDSADGYAELVGWGTSSERKNIRSLDTNGNQALRGALTTTDLLTPTANSGTIGTNSKRWNYLFVNNADITTNLTIGSNATIIPNGKISGNLIPTDNERALGSSTYKWKTAYITTLNSTTISASSISATTFTGDLTGNATSATKATKDGSDNVITTSYGTSLSHPKDSSDNDIMNQISLMDNDTIKTALNTITINDVSHATNADNATNDANGGPITKYAHVKYGTGTTSTSATTDSNLKITKSGNNLYIWTESI